MVKALIRNEIVFVSMRTGWGKSLTFQLAALITKGLTIVVSPLVSLIKNQWDALHVPALYCSGDQSSDEQSETFVKLESGKYKLLYLAPEKLILSQKLAQTLNQLYKKGKIAELEVDEAHYVVIWGRNFRENYLKIFSFRESYPTVPIAAFTAAITELTKNDIVETLHMGGLHSLPPHLIDLISSTVYSRKLKSALQILRGLSNTRITTNAA